MICRMEIDTARPNLKKHRLESIIYCDIEMVFAVRRLIMRKISSTSVTNTKTIVESTDLQMNIGLLAAKRSIIVRYIRSSIFRVSIQLAMSSILTAGLADRDFLDLVFLHENFDRSYLSLAVALTDGGFGRADFHNK